MITSILYSIIIGFFGLILVMMIINIIVNQRAIPHYSYERALRSYQKLQRKGGNQWKTTLLGLILGNIIIWVTMYKSEPLSIFISVLICANVLFVVLAANEFEALRLTTKRLRELESEANTPDDLNGPRVEINQADREE